jgi:hypothetical protein
MPEGWQAKAKELGALPRKREIKKAIDVLHLVFIYLTEEKSLSAPAALLKLTATCSISKKAVFTPLQPCEYWLCENIYRHNNVIVEPPTWLGERTV